MISVINRRSLLSFTTRSQKIRFTKRELNIFSSEVLEVLKAIGAAKVIGSIVYYVYNENRHLLLGSKDGQKAEINKALTKSLFASVPHLHTTMQDENSYFNRFKGVHVLGHSLVNDITPIKSYYDIRKQLFNVESDTKKLVVTVAANTSCLVFYSDKVKQFEPLMLKRLLEATFDISKQQIESLESSGSSAEETRSLLDNMKPKKKLAFVSTVNGAITVSRPRFIVLEYNGKKTISFIVQTESGATLFGVPATPEGIRTEDFITNFKDDYKFSFFKVLISKGYPLKYTIAEMFKLFPRRVSYEVLSSGHMYLHDFVKLLHKLSDVSRINFFIQDPSVEIYPLTTSGKICMKGTYVKPGPAGYFVQLTPVHGTGSEALYQVTMAFLDSSRHCELQENGFMDGGYKKMLLC